MAKKLLLVQNQDNLRRLMGAFFSQQFEVIAAKTGLEAMSWLSRGFIPDVIIADASGTPELSGVQLATNLRYSGMFGHIPVILIGSAADDVEKNRLREFGIRGVFGNPFDPVQLRERVTQLAALGSEYKWAGANAA